MLHHVYAVIMAGGRGERFWPQSRSCRPKQFLQLLGEGTMIEQTVERLKPLLPGGTYPGPHELRICGYGPHAAAVAPRRKHHRRTGGRDTAPCAALAAGIVKSARAGKMQS